MIRHLFTNYHRDMKLPVVKLLQFLCFLIVPELSSVLKHSYKDAIRIDRNVSRRKPCELPLAMKRVFGEHINETS